MGIKDKLDIDTARKFAWTHPDAWRTKLEGAPPKAAAPPPPPSAAATSEAATPEAAPSSEPAAATSEAAPSSEPEAATSEAAPSSEPEAVEGGAVPEAAVLEAVPEAPRVAPAPPPAPRRPEREDRAATLAKVTALGLEIERVFELPDEERRAHLEPLVAGLKALGLDAKLLDPQTAVHLALMVVPRIAELQPGNEVSFALGYARYSGPRMLELIELTARSTDHFLSYAMKGALFPRSEVPVEQRIPGASALLVRLLGEDSGNARIVAARWCKADYFQGIVAPLRRAIRSTCFELRGEALHTLADHGTRERRLITEDDLRVLLEDLVARGLPEDPRLFDAHTMFRLGLESALAERKQPWIAPLLAQAFAAVWESDASDPHAISELLFSALVERDPATACRYVDLALAASSPRARATALELAAQLPAELAKPRFALAASDPVRLVSEAARAGLVKLGATQAVPFDALEQAELRTTKAILEALQLDASPARVALHREAASAFAHLTHDGAIDNTVEACFRAVERVTPLPPHTIPAHVPQPAPRETVPLDPNAPHPMALLTELLVRVGPRFCFAEAPKKRTDFNSSWGRALALAGGLDAVRAVLFLARHYPGDGGPIQRMHGRYFNTSWLRVLADLFERPVIAIPEAEATAARAIAWDVLRRALRTSSPTPLTSLGETTLRRVNHHDRAEDTLHAALALLASTKGSVPESFVSPLLTLLSTSRTAHAAKTILAQLEPSAAFDKQLLARADGTWARRDVETFMRYALLGLDRDLPEMRPRIARALEQGDDYALRQLARRAYQAGIVDAAWGDRMLADTSSWRFAIACEAVLGPKDGLAAAHAARLFEVLEGPDGEGLGGAARVVAAYTLLCAGRLPVRDPRVLFSLRPRDAEGSPIPPSPKPTYAEIRAERPFHAALACTLLMTHAHFSYRDVVSGVVASPELQAQLEAERWPYVARVLVHGDSEQRSTACMLVLRNLDYGATEPVSAQFAAETPELPEWVRDRLMRGKYASEHPCWDEDKG